MKAFVYKDELYIRAVPGKTLFRSTMVHEVVNRGDIFAVRVSDQQLTVVPGDAQVTHCEWPLEHAQRSLELSREQLIRKTYREKLLAWVQQRGLFVSQEELRAKLHRDNFSDGVI